MLPSHGDIYQWMQNREIGTKISKTFTDRLHSTLYSNICCVRSWDPLQEGEVNCGAIFNFDFAPDGRLCVAACEQNCLLVFDPNNGKLIATRNDAHTDCVNCVRFLDSRMFVTCSDDTNVCLWDVRHLKYQVRVLEGHSNWVKNIEYAREARLLVTSGFDGSVYVWDINSYSSDCGQRVFHTEGLMRSKLSPDGSQLIITTRSGYLMVIHDLDLNTLKEDLRRFKPTAFRMKQINRARRGQDVSYLGRIFTRRHNRVEILSDFPADDAAEMIASLEVHPRGWCVASRNSTSDDSSEWTCIHDIQTLTREQVNNQTDKPRTSRWASGTSDENLPCTVPSNTETDKQPDDASSSTETVTNNQSAKATNFPSQSSRLLHYIDEPNVGRGFIKELSFSHDGRLLSSPFAFGIRLLAFNSTCSELAYCEPESAVQLHEVGTSMAHKQVVLTSKFSPLGGLIVSGCLGGVVNFHQPIF